MHRNGTATYQNGDRYVGTFKEGQCDGQGKYIYADGRGEYEGKYEKNKRHDFGTMKYKNGIEFIQTY